MGGVGGRCLTREGVCAYISRCVSIWRADDTFSWRKTLSSVYDRLTGWGGTHAPESRRCGDLADGLVVADVDE